MKSDDIPISELIEKLDNDGLCLPEIQRGYVWKAKQVSDLLDSLYRGYPSGTILTWEAGAGIPRRKLAADNTPSMQAKNKSAQAEDNDKASELLLDGQQRLTSLLAILKGRWVRVKDKDVLVPTDTLFNLRHPEIPEINETVSEVNEFTDLSGKAVGIYDKMTFATSNVALKRKKHWISVSKFFENPDIEQFLKKQELDSSDSGIQRYRERLKKLKGILDYKYRVDTLEERVSYEEVTEIFVRVNSRGTELKGSDLALAQITVRWPNSLRLFEEFAEECKAEGFDFDLGLYIKNLVVFATGQCKFDVIKRIPSEVFENSWSEAKEGMRFALNFLKSNVGMDSDRLISTPFLAILVAYYSHKKSRKLTAEEAKNLRRWILLANIKGRYSRGSTESVLDKDLSSVKENVGLALGKLLEDLEIQVGTLGVSTAELRDRKTNSAYFNTMFMAFKEAGAEDWHHRTKILFNSKGKYKLEFHHIFPKKILKNYEKHQINDIANLAFITSETNKKIGGKEPREYIADFEGYKDLFAKQRIPTDSRLLDTQHYEEFLEERRKLIAKRLNEFLGSDYEY